MSSRASTSAMATAGRLRSRSRPLTSHLRPTPSTSTSSVPYIPLPNITSRASYSDRKPKSTPRYNFNTSLSWDSEPDPDHVRYRRVTARDIKHRQEPPTKVKMLVRDFIDDSLYNPQYGYFSKQAQIFSPPSASTSESKGSVGFDIPSFPNLTAFQEHVAEAYEQEYAVQPTPPAPAVRSGKGKGKETAVAERIGQMVAAEEGTNSKGEGWSTKDQGGRGGAVVPGGLGRQVWHTPTELFKPHYSRIIARALLSHYKLHHYPYTDFHLYEMGAGNGSLMIDILTFLKEEHPEVFERTRYTIVEISGQLAARQRKRAREAGFLVEEEGGEGEEIEEFERGRGRGGKVRVVNKDWFEWEGEGKHSSYLVALEVFDNFAHDMIRYDLKTMEPMQAMVCIDAHGDFSLLYEPITDPIIRRYLAYRRLLQVTNGSFLTPSSVAPPINPLLLSSPTLRNFYASLPFAPNLTPPEFLPTKQMLFLESLREKMPNHKLLVADFDTLPDTVPGRCGPVVQTRYGGSMVPCETFLVKQGYFDIFFPTDFELLRDMYASIMTSPSRKLSSSFFSSTKQPTSKQAAREQRNPPADLMGVRGFKHNKVSVYSHSDFLSHFGTQQDLEAAETKDGGNVMLGMYKNAKFLF